MPGRTSVNLLPPDGDQRAESRPALASIKAAIAYLGSPSPAFFYETLLPKLSTVRLGSRTFIEYRALDELVEQNRRPAGASASRRRGQVQVWRAISGIDIEERPPDPAPISPRPDKAGRTHRGRASRDVRRWP
jgi:hypothetical protein